VEEDGVTPVLIPGSVSPLIHRRQDQAHSPNLPSFPPALPPSLPPSLRSRGPNRYAANSAFTALVAAEFGFEVESFRSYAASQINYMLGRLLPPSLPPSLLLFLPFPLPSFLP